MSVPGWRARALAVLEYAGAAPFLHARRADDPFRDGHHGHALGLLFALVCVGLLFVAGILLVTVAIMLSRSLYQDYHIEIYVLSGLRKVFLAWCVFWAFSVVTALLGREAHLPLIWRLARRDGLMRFSARLWAGIFVAAVLIGAFAAHASTKFRQDAAPGKVYVLYEDRGGDFPRWLFAIGFYPIAAAAEERYGPGNVVMLRISREGLRRALGEAAFIFLGTHGTHAGILVPDGYFRTSDVRPGEANAGLQYVYMTGCDQGAGWEAVFAPARVVTFNRLTTVLEHIWWMWSEGPREVRALK